MSSTHPVIAITIDGVPVSAVFLDRLISVTVTDKEGTRSDTIDLELDAGPPFLSIPRKKAIIRAFFDGTYMGAFTADDVTLHCIPYHISIQGKSADMRDSLKEHRARHWDDKTFGDVVQQIAGENGLTAQIDGDIASFRGRDGYFAQEMESGLHFIERQARRLDGLFAIKDGKLIVAKKGSGKTAGGAAVGGLVVTPEMIIKGSCEVQWTERENHKEVRGAYHDSGEAKRKYEKAPSNPDGSAVLTLRHQFANKDEAKRAATAKANELRRQANRTSCEIVGNAGARGGAGWSYSGVHPEVDGLPFIVETAAHTFTKSGGWVVKVDANAKV